MPEEMSMSYPEKTSRPPTPVRDPAGVVLVPCIPRNQVSRFGVMAHESEPEDRPRTLMQVRDRLGVR